MLKSINCRAILPVACAVTGFVIACCLLLYSFIKTDLIRGEIQHAADLADTVVKSTRYAMLNGDRETLRFLAELDRFPFSAQLATQLSRSGGELAALRRAGAIRVGAYTEMFSAAALAL